MAKRGRPRKNPVPESVSEGLKKEKEIQDFVSEGMIKNDPIPSKEKIDISDVDYVEPPKNKLGESYNPFAESVEEKAYRSVKLEDSSLATEIAEPIFERPSFQDLLKENESQVEESGLGGAGDGEEANPFSQDEIRELPDKQQEDAAKGLVEQALNMYTLGCKGLGSLAKIKESKVDKLASEGLIDLNLQVPIDAHTSVSVPQVVQGFNNEIEDTFSVDDDFKDSVRPAMTRVFVKKGWGMTDEQQLMLAFGMDIAQKGAILMKLRKEGNMQIERFIEITEISRGRNVQFVTPDHIPSVTPEEQDSEPALEVVKSKRKKAESNMVGVINPDINISKHDLDQVDVDNV